MFKYFLIILEDYQIILLHNLDTCGILVLPVLDNVRNILPMCPLEKNKFLQNCFCLFVKTSSLFLPNLKVLLVEVTKKTLFLYR